MRIPSIKTSHLLVRLLPMIVCLCLSHGVSRAQSDAGNTLQIDPPAVPKNRKPRPAFTVQADPDSKPLPPPPVVPASSLTIIPTDTPVKHISPAEEQAKKEAQKRREDREIAESDHRQEMLSNIGKVLGFLVVVGVGIFSMTDITRQIRRAKYKAAHRVEDDDDGEWEP